MTFRKVLKEIASEFSWNPTGILGIQHLFFRHHSECQRSPSALEAGGGRWAGLYQPRSEGSNFLKVEA
jgi:hypothetical protein